MKQRILVVDDETSIRDLLRHFFEKHQFEVVTAPTAAEAFAFLETSSVEIILLDMMLPDGDGLEILETLKQVHPSIPVIMMTGLGMDEEALEKALERGASAYLSKTVPLDQLLAEVRRALSQTIQ